MQNFIFGLIFAAIFSACSIFNPISPCNTEKKRGKFKPSIGMSCDSIPIEGFASAIDCFTHDELLAIRKQLPGKLKRYSFGFSYFSELQNGCLGYYEMTYCYKRKNHVHFVSYPIIRLSDSIIVSFSNRNRKLTKSDVSELAALLSEEAIDEIVKYYNEGKDIFIQPYLTEEEVNRILFINHF